MNGIREFAAPALAVVAQLPCVLVIGLALAYIAVHRASRKYGE